MRGRWDDECDFSFAEAEGGFDGFGEARAVLVGGGDAILDDGHDRRETLHFQRLVNARGVAVEPDAEVALRLEEVEKVGGFRASGRGHAEGHEQRFARVLRVDLVHDRLRRLGPDFALALRAERRRDAREEQLHVVVDLRHRPHRRARALHRIRLLDGDGRRDAADRIHLRLVHTVEKLPRVRRERLHIPPLPLRVDRVKGEARFPAAARPRDDVQLAQRQIEVDAAQIILPRASNLNHTGVRNEGQLGLFH